jgi:hypothetical protein
MPVSSQAHQRLHTGAFASQISDERAPAGMTAATFDVSTSINVMKMLGKVFGVKPPPAPLNIN